MRRLFLLFALAGLVCSFAVANPLCVNDGSLQTYITSYTAANPCQIGDKLFWGFTLSAGPNSIGAEPTASGIQVQPVPGDGLTNIGISFNSGGWVASGGIPGVSDIPIDAILTYHVASMSGLAVIKDATVSITGTLPGTGGSAVLTETLTPGVAGSPLTASLPSSATDHIDFSSTLMSTFLVKDELILTGGPNERDIAHVSVFENDFSELVTIPEPFVSALIGSGLLLFGVVRRRHFPRG